MQYLVTTTSSQPGLQDSHVCIVGHVDYMPFMRFDSDGAAQRIQTRGPWMKQMGPEYLEMERKNAERYSHRARENLRFAIQVYNQSDKGEWPLHISMDRPDLHRVPNPRFRSHSLCRGRESKRIVD